MRLAIVAALALVACATDNQAQQRAERRAIETWGTQCESSGPRGSTPWQRCVGARYESAERTFRGSCSDWQLRNERSLQECVIDAASRPAGIVGAPSAPPVACATMYLGSGISTTTCQ